MGETLLPTLICEEQKLPVLLTERPLGKDGTAQLGRAIAWAPACPLKLLEWVDSEATLGSGGGGHSTEFGILI